MSVYTRLAALLAVIAVSLLLASPTYGDTSSATPTPSPSPTVEANNEDNTLDIDLEVNESGTTSYEVDVTTVVTAETGTPVPPPTFIPECERGGLIGTGSAFGCAGKQLECEGGLVFTVITYAADGSSSTDPYVCIKTEDVPEQTPVDIPGEVLKAFKSVPIGKSNPFIQPPNGQTLVNLETIFSTDAKAFTTDVPLEKVGITVTLAVTPESFRWHFGDGTSTTTDWAGRKWSEGEDVSKLITHVYTQVDDNLPVSVDVTWGATWKVKGTNGDPEPVNGTVTVEGDAQQIAVREAKPLLVKQ